MTSTMRNALAAVLFISIAAGAEERPPEPETPSHLSARFKAALECEKPEKDRSLTARVRREWCAVGQIEQTGFLVPKSRHIYLGVSLGVGSTDDILNALSHRPELALLTIDERGALVTSLPSSEELKPMGALGSLDLVLKGRDKQVHVSHEMMEWLKPSIHNKLHPLQPDGKAATFEALLPSHIYLVKGAYGEGYVVFEQDEAGTRVNLFPIVPLTSE